MNNEKQEELIRSFLAELGKDTRPLYQDIIACLTELGYRPVKERSNLSFKHSLHNKQIAKTGLLKNKEGAPFFALRFSACRNYSEKIAGIVAAYTAKYPKRAAACTDGPCTYCKGEPDTHVYHYTLPDGGTGAHCGAYAVELQGITVEDAEEIKALIREEHAYLLKHEAGLAEA